jgi:uncharacterized protein (TIGR00288 family)
VADDKLKLAVFIDFDNIQIGVKDTLGKEFDVSLVLESLKERGEVVAKVAYGDWSRSGDQSRVMTQHAIQMVQRSVTPRGDKNGADINLALDALEMAFTRHHINAFAIVGGDSDFMALVEKLKQFDKRVFVIGGRAFTSNILQKNCTEFIAYENLLKSSSGDGRAVRAARRPDATARAVPETRALSESLPNIQRAIKILADRGVSPQLGLLKSTLLQLDSTFSERDYGAGSFLEFMEKVDRAGLVHLRRTERGYLVEPVEGDSEAKAVAADSTASAGAAKEPASEPAETGASADGGSSPEGRASTPAPDPSVLNLLRQAIAAAAEKSPGRPLYLRQVRQRLRALDPSFDERRYGFRGTLDLLHHAQREGWLKVLRDHSGVWRVYPIASPTESATTPEPTTQPEVEPDQTAAAAEIEIAIEASCGGEQQAAEESSPSDTGAPLLETVETSPEPIPQEESPAERKPKPRRTRAAKPSSAGRRPRNATVKAVSTKQETKNRKQKSENTGTDMLGFPDAVS